MREMSQADKGQAVILHTPSFSAMLFWISLGRFSKLKPGMWNHYSNTAEIRIYLGSHTNVQKRGNFLASKVFTSLSVAQSEVREDSIFPRDGLCQDRK